MNSPPEATKSINKNQGHPYPLVRSGGLFLLLIGAGIIIDTALKGAFLVGTLFAVLSLMFSKVLSFGKPTISQLAALAVAIVLEIVLLIIMVNVLPADISRHIRLMWVLIIVGIHFLPMAVCFGPRLLIIGLLCIVNGLIGLILNNLPSDLLLLIDGVLKVGFGLWLFKRPFRDSH